MIFQKFFVKRFQKKRDRERHIARNKYNEFMKNRIFYGSLKDGFKLPDYDYTSNIPYKQSVFILKNNGCRDEKNKLTLTCGMCNFGSICKYLKANHDNVIQAATQIVINERQKKLNRILNDTKI